MACRLQVDADPDPAYHFDADPDPDPAYHLDADPDPTFQFNADPDPQHYLSPSGYTDPTERSAFSSLVFKVNVYYIQKVKTRSNRRNI